MKLKICGMKISSRSRKRRAAHFRKSKYAFDKSLFTFSAVHLFLPFSVNHFANLWNVFPVSSIRDASRVAKLFLTRAVENCFRLKEEKWNPLAPSPSPPPHDNFHLEGFNRSFILICMRTSRCQCLYVNHASSYRHRGADPHALNPTLDAPFCGVNDARGKTTTVYRRSMAFFFLLFFFFFSVPLSRIALLEIYFVHVANLKDGIFLRLFERFNGGYILSRDKKKGISFWRFSRTIRFSPW